ncbi:MAG: type IV secretion system protein [Azospirillum sp.]|nr:type IV secretion system protein [Azospirillum sp.]
MTINKFIKYTSLLVLGTWMLSAPGNAFAENEAVSKDVNEIINRLMAPDDNSTGAKKLENEELAKIRSKLLSEIKGLQEKYKENMKGIENYQKQIEELQKKVGEVEKELNGFEKTAIIGGALAIIGTVGLAIGTGGVGLVIVGVATAVGAIAAEHYAEDPDSLRRLINGSYTWSTQRLISNTKTIDASSITNVEAKDEKQKQALQKALSVVQEYNAVAQQLHKLGESALSTARQLDQKVEELNSMQTTIKAGQSLYKYTIMGKTKDGKPTILAEYYFIMEGDKFQSITGVTRGCVPLPAKLAESRSCIYCPLFKTIFNAAQSMSTKAYDKLAGPLANVMLIGFAIVIAFMVLKNVSSFTKQDAPKFITELLVNMFKVLVAYYMLKNANIVYGYIVGPVLKAGFEFGSSLLFAENKYLAACDVSKTLQNVSNGVMPAYLYTNLDCFIRAVQAEVAVPQSVGSSLMCVARNAGKESIGPVRNVLWDFGMMFQGFAIWVMGWIISLAFAFYLIDATIQLGIIGALMPFLIACWPFKATRNYTSKGWGIFMNTFFVYVFMGLVVSINVELLGQGLTGSKGGFDAIMKALNGNNVQELKELLDIGFAGFLVLVACCLFAFKLTGQASDLAGTMAGGGGPKIGANIGGLAYGAATKGVQGTLKTGLGAAKAVSDKTGLTNVVNKGRDWAKDKVWGAVGLGRRSGAAGNKQARRSQMGDQQQQQQSSTDGQTPQTQTRPATPGAPNPTAQNQIKKMQQAGPRSQQPATPSPQTPTNPSTPQGGAAQGGTPHGNQADAQQTQTPQQTPEQMRQQLESDYNNTANGRAGRQMIQNQTAEVARNQKAENEAQGKMNYHNRRADDYLKKAQSASDPAQKKNFENLANAQFEEAVKAEAAYNKAKADTQKAQSELDAIKQENERYKNQYVQDEMKKRNPKK